MKIVNKSLKLGLLVCVGLLVVGCSTHETMTKEEQVLSDKMKIAMLGEKKEFIANMNQRGKDLEKAYKDREKWMKNPSLIPSNTTDPVLIRILQQRKILEHATNPKNRKGGLVYYTKDILDYNGPKPDENKKFDDPGTQMIHEQNIKLYRESKMKKNSLNQSSEESIINELGGNSKKENKLIKAFENLPDLTDEQQAKVTGLRAGLLINEGQYTKAIPLCKQVIKYYKNHSINSENDLGGYNGLIISYMKLGLFEESLKVSSELISIIQKNNFSKEMLSGVYSLHGMNYMLLKNYNKAIEYYKKSLNYEKENRVLSRRYKHIADAYMKMGQRDKASLYLNKSIQAKR